MSIPKKSSFLTSAARFSADIPGRLSRKLRAKRSGWGYFLNHWIKPHDLDRCGIVLKTMRHSRLQRPKLVDFNQPCRVLVIAPHPDDEVIGMGGTLSMMSAAGYHITVLYLTDGDNDPDLRQIRKKEAGRSAKNFKFDDQYMGYDALNIPVDEHAIKSFAELISQLSPEIIFLPFLLDDHDDHRRASELYWRAAQKHAALTIPELWCYQVYSTIPTNVIVDISDHSNAKADAIANYQSQMKKRDWAHFALGMNAVNTRYLTGGARAKYIECFLRLTAHDYFKLCEPYFGDDATDCYYTPDYRNSGAQNG